MSKRVVRFFTSRSGRLVASGIPASASGTSVSPVLMSITGKRIGRSRPPIEPSFGTAESSARV